MQAQPAIPHDGEPPSVTTWSMPTAQKAITVAGCLGTAYLQLTVSPATVEFARSLGASGLEFGILGALPSALIFFQLVAAIMAQQFRSRKWPWIAMSLIQRVICVPAALGPIFFPDSPNWIWIWALLISTAVNHAMLQFLTPLWLAWMGDYIPHQNLNAFWGVRQVWKHWTALAALLLSTGCFIDQSIEIDVAFAILIIAGAICGVADILLFIWVEEPPVEHMEQPSLRNVLLGPFRDRAFRTFIYFSSFWSAAAMIGAPFISLYLLDYIGMDIVRVLLLWTFSWVGGALFSRKLGELADRHGHRPVIILCTAFKSTLMIVLLALPRDPTAAFWILLPVFMLDAVFNAGIALANNGYMLKNSPTDNRPMFIAAGLAYAGMAGGVASTIAGLAIGNFQPVYVDYLGMEFVDYHFLFAVSILFRLLAVWLATFVREAHSHSTSRMTVAILRSIHWPSLRGLTVGR